MSGTSIWTSGVEPGPPGPRGPSGTLSVGNVATGAAGSSVSITNSGTAEAAILNFTIPRGDQGIGIQGPPGNDGAPGIQGQPGTPGANGSQILYGNGFPAAGVGVNGDSYIDTASYILYGPKSSNTWPSTGIPLGATLNVDNYDTLRGYTGTAYVFNVTDVKTSGMFFKRVFVTGDVDNGGTKLVSTNGSFTYERRYYGALNLGWFEPPAQGVSSADDYPAFIKAIAALPAGGGTIAGIEGTYYLSAVPAEGTKSITYMIGPAATFAGPGTGEGKFGYMLSNPAQLAVGMYTRSRSSQHSTNANGGIAALNVEMIQPNDYVGQSVAGYFGAIGSNPTAGANVWALNTLVRAQAGALGTYQCIEIDVDNFASGALVKGISISGAGTVGPRVAVEILRANATPWAYGLDVLNTVVGMRIRNTASTRMGIVIGSPAAQLAALISGQQLANADDGVLLQRFTDTSPTGNFFRAVNAANSQSLFTVGIDGSVNSAGNITATGAYVRGNNLDVTGPVTASPTGVFRFSATTSTTVGSAGGAAALPTTPLGYISASNGGTTVKIPFFAAT